MLDEKLAVLMERYTMLASSFNKIEGRLDAFQEAQHRQEIQLIRLAEQLEAERANIRRLIAYVGGVGGILVSLLLTALWNIVVKGTP